MLVFLRLNTPEEAITRVAQRVRQGGHDIPETVIRRRFAAGLRNFDAIYAPAADSWVLCDNSGKAPRSRELQRSTASARRVARCEPAASAVGVRRTARGVHMNLQHDRISALCEAMKLDAVADRKSVV